MEIPGLGSLIENTVGKAVDGLIQKYLPASMSEQEKANFQLELEKLMAEREKTIIEAQTSFMQAAAQYENPAGISQWMLNFRASVRPVITYAAFLLVAYIIICGTLGGARLDWSNLTKIPSEIWFIFLSIIGFWFGGRAVWDAKNGKNN